MSSGVALREVSKSISRFLPVTTQPPEESERHYSQVHFPWAQRLLAEREQVLTYHTNRVLRQYDQTGGFARRPTAWRFVLLTFEPGRGLELDADTAERIAQDHPNCLRALRATPVESSLVLDRLDGQPVLAKYLIELDRAEQTPQEQADRRIEELVDGLAQRLEDAAGFRSLWSNRVLGEAEAEAVVEEGQRVTGQLLPDTDKCAYLEVYFDDTSFGDQFFARDEVLGLLENPSFATLAVYHVEERCGLDRR